MVGGGDHRSIPAAHAARARSLIAGVATAGVAVAGGVVALGVGASVAAATHVVDSTADLPDVTPGDGVCATAGPAPVCTLRAAIDESNARTGHDVITFAIAGSGPHRIEPDSALPLIADPAGVTIDGYTQPGASANTLAIGSNAVLRIELRGQGPISNAGGTPGECAERSTPPAYGIDGLDLRSGNNVVRGLAVFDFRRNVRLFGPGAAGNTVVGNFIGTDATGTFRQHARVTTGNGVHIEAGASGNVIGTPLRSDRNVISGNADRGVGLFDVGTDGNVIQNNLIGTAPDGTTRLRNCGHGVDVNHDASFNRIGGWTAGEGNVISGNELSGVEISHNEVAVTEGNQVLGNLIGTNAAGTSAPFDLRNREFGVNLEGKPRCAGSCALDIARNIVSGNVIVGSRADVIIWKGATENVVSNNAIGVLADGSVAASTSLTQWAVLIEAGAIGNEIVGNTIGDTTDGVQVRPVNDYPSSCRPGDPVCPADARFPTYGNTISRNVIRGVAPGLGIDLWPVGAVTDLPPADVQGGILLPAIMAASTDGVTVAACAGCTVELFLAEASIFSGHGQATRFLGAATADGAGRATFVFRSSVSDPYVARPGELLSATSTDSVGNTSEFSERATVAAGVVPPPASTSTTTTTTTTSTVPLPPSTPLPPIPAPHSGRAAATQVATRCQLGHC